MAEKYPNCQMELRNALEKIARTRITHLRARQMQAALHDMRKTAQFALTRVYGGKEFAEE